MPAAFSMMGGGRRDREEGGPDGSRAGGNGRAPMPDAFARMGQQSERPRGRRGHGHALLSRAPPPHIGGQKELSDFIRQAQTKKSANTQADKPAAAAAEAAPAVDDAVTKAAAMGLEVARRPCPSAPRRPRRVPDRHVQTERRTRWPPSLRCARQSCRLTSRTSSPSPSGRPSRATAGSSPSSSTPCDLSSPCP